MDYVRLVKWLAQDEDQLNCVRELVAHRGGSLTAYIKRGIMYVPDLDEFEYIAEQIGSTLEELGVTETNKWLFEGGFIVPVLDSRYELLFYINHDFRRDKSKKYLNIYTDFYGGREKEMKMYGLHNTRRAVRQNRVVVVEGLFDAIRLEMHGIPAVAQLGTKLMAYHRSFYKRFDRVIYIPDNDTSGEAAWRKFREGVPDAEVYKINGVHNDVDAYGKANTREYKEWIGELKKLGNKEV